MQQEDAYPERLSWSPQLKLVVGVTVFALTLLALYAFRTALVPLIIGSIIAYVLYPVAAQISNLTGLKHGQAAGVLYLFILALVIPLVVLLVPIITRQAIALQENLVTFLTNLDFEATLQIPIIGTQLPVQQVVDQVTSTLANSLASIAERGIPLLFNAAQVIVYAFFTFVIAFYLTRDGNRFVLAAIDAVPASLRADFRALITDLDKVWRSFVRGQLLLSFTVFVILTILASVLGLPQPLLIGLLGGLLEFLPSIGNMIWGAIAVTVALASGSTWIDLPNTTFALITFAAYIAFAQLDINVLIPNIIGGQVRLHPVVVLVGVIVGLQVAGVLGVALAAPTIASARVILRYIYERIFDQEPPPPSIEGAAREELERETAAEESETEELPGGAGRPVTDSGTK